MATLSAVPAARCPLKTCRRTAHRAGWNDVRAGIFPDEGNDRRRWRRAEQAAADDLEQLRCGSAARWLLVGTGAAAAHLPAAYLGGTGCQYARPESQGGTWVLANRMKVLYKLDKESVLAA